MKLPGHAGWHTCRHTSQTVFVHQILSTIVSKLKNSHWFDNLWFGEYFPSFVLQGLALLVLVQATSLATVVQALVVDNGFLPWLISFIRNSLWVCRYTLFFVMDLVDMYVLAVAVWIV